MSVGTCCAPIDSVTGGGFALGELSEVCGEAGVGKTQLCLQAAAKTVANVGAGGDGSAAIYITYNSLFLVDRFRATLQRVQQGDMRQPMDRIISLSWALPSDLTEIMHNLETMLRSNQGPCMSVRLIVIDTIYEFIEHHFPDTEAGQKDKGAITRYLGHGFRTLARKYNVAVVACNNVAEPRHGSLGNTFVTSMRRVRPGIDLNWERYLFIRYVMAYEHGSGDGSWGRMFGIFHMGQFYGQCKYALTEVGVVEEA